MTEDAKKFLADATASKPAAEKAATAVSDGKALERWRIEFLGRKSPLGRLSKSLTSLVEGDRPAAISDRGILCASARALFGRKRRPPLSRPRF